MTVRWKPLLILSGLFVVIAIVGVIAMAFTLLPRDAAEILPVARAERSAGRFDHALIYYQQALQKDGKNPATHEEMAAMFADWAAKAPAEKAAGLRASRLASLVEANKYGKALKEPLRQLLDDAMRYDEPTQGEWAKRLLQLEPGNADARYVLACDALEQRTPNVPEIRQALSGLEAAKASPARIAWLRARIAQLTNDDAPLRAVLTEARGLSLPDDAPPADRTALLRLRALDVQTTTELDPLPGRVEALEKEAGRLLAARSVATGRIVRVSLLLEQIQRTLLQRAAGKDGPTRARLEALVEAIDGQVEAIFKKALAGGDAGPPDLQVSLSYADHLRFRGKRDACLKAVDAGLKAPPTARKNAPIVVNGLHAVAVETALGDLKDPARFDKAAPHIKELIGCAFPRYQGLGHLFRGAIDLERAGEAGPARAAAAVAVAAAGEGAKAGAGTVAGNDAPAPPSPSPADQAKFRSSALSHLKTAAALLPDVAEAQARYGVALVLAMEPGLGRQYLQKAVHQGDLDPQYQIWAAWSMVQAGYPEEAEPIVNHLFGEVAGGRQSRGLEGTLHLLSAEIHQARRTPEELKKAQAEYERSVAAGQSQAGTAIPLRLAQIDVQLGRPEQALERIGKLRDGGHGGPGAEQLAVLTLQEMGRADEARKALDDARKRFPDSEELAGLDASLLARSDRPKEAERVLADFLARDPENVPLALMRAQLLAERLDDAKGARRLLVDLAERSDNSSPLVQLALVELRQKDYDAVSATIAKIRGRWKEAAAADLLEAQLAMDQGNLGAASAAFDAALVKDPNNKMVQFWKAQLDSRNGDAPEAARALESIVKERPTKELDSGLSLTAAAESALANLALASGDLDAAIARFEELRQGEAGTLARPDRWQLVAAYIAKKQWPAAKREIAAMLNDKERPPSNDERVRAANYYRQNGEEAAARAQVDYVLRVDPVHPAAVVTRSYLLAASKDYDESAALLRKAIDGTKGKPAAVFFLLLAAVENSDTRGDDAARKAAGDRALAALDRGLAARPDALELVQAKYRLLRQLRGPRAAVAFVEAQARDAQGDDFRRLLVEVYSAEKDHDGAERVLRDLLKKNPRDAAVAANLVRLATIRAIEAAGRGDEPGRRAADDKAAALIREFRGQFPGDLTFLRMECDLAARRGDLARAIAVTREMDKLAKNSTAGPLARARIYTIQGRTREVAEAYGEALERNPRQLDARVLLGQARLKLAEPDEALRQAGLVLEADKDRVDATLLRAQALADQPGPDRQVAANRAEAVAALRAAVKRQPKLPEAYHLIATIEAKAGHRDRAVAALKEGLRAVPDDPAGVSQLVELMTAPPADGGRPDPAALAEARDLARSIGEKDASGKLTLALAMGFQKAGQFDLALPWAEKAAAKLDAPTVHLQYGDLLLSAAEGTKDPDQARVIFRRAVDEYDRVLKAQATSVEAINNKAWILHAHLGDSRAALELALGLLKQADPATLPPEFFDTLGAVQEATGRPRDAEDSYSRGLRKVSDHPVLNFHMGKLLLAGHDRKARTYLEKAYAGRDRLSPQMADEVAALIKQGGRP